LKKRAMKKYIPKDTMYCYQRLSPPKYENGKLVTLKIKQCPWRTYYGTRHVSGEYKGKHYEEDIPVFGCKYLGYVDYDQESLLWDGCKECSEKEGD